MSRRNEKMPMDIQIWSPFKMVRTGFTTLDEIQIVFQDQNNNVLSVWCNREVVPTLIEQLKKLQEGRS